MLEPDRPLTLRCFGLAAVTVWLLLRPSPSFAAADELAQDPNPAPPDLPSTAPTPVPVQRPAAASLDHAVPGVLPARQGRDPRLVPAPAAAPTTPPAAPIPAASPTVTAATPAGTAGPAVARQMTPARDPITHNGFVTSAEVGMTGCTRQICTSSHAAAPGVKVGGLLGANIGGFVDIGLGAAWGRLRPDVQPRTNALELFGVDPNDVAASADQMGFDVRDLDVEDASMSTLQVGPRLRLHFVPRGRVAVYAGAGFEYLRLHHAYTTRDAPLSLDFHGFAVPLHGGVDTYVAPRIALGVHFDYALSYYAAVVARHPDQTMALPMSVLESVLDDGDNPRANLPHFWSTTFGVRFTL